MSNSPLVNLPVELLHRIFDHLDAYIIVLSVRCVCRQLHAVVNSYNRFQLNFDSTVNSYRLFSSNSNSMRNSNFKIVSRLVQPSNVISLMFSGGYADQWYIDVFLANFNISQFTRLRSLTLHKVNSIEINQFFQHVTTNSLVSLAVNMHEIEDNYTAFSIIFPVMIQTNLQTLRLDNLDYENNRIAWPIQSTLEHLTIRDCSYDQYRIILCNSLRLRTLVIMNCTVNNTDQTVSSYAVTTSNSAKRQRTSIDSAGTELDMHPSAIIYLVVELAILFGYMNFRLCSKLESKTPCAKISAF
jgi:hypothetical protein